MLIARVLMVLSAGIAFILGALHVVYTFWGAKLMPRDSALQIRMSQISPIITKETTMWRTWIGFNASHSVGAILFGAVYSYLSLSHGEFLSQSPFLLLLGLLFLIAFAVLAKRYWFSAPFRGILLATAFYVAALVLNFCQVPSYNVTLPRKACAAP